MQASSARSGQRLVQREPGPGALARARDSVAEKGRGHGRNSGERFCGRPGENDAQTMYRGERKSIETEGGAQVWAREIRQACPEKESPRKGNLLGMSFSGEKAHCEQRRCLSSAL